MFMWQIVHKTNRKSNKNTNKRTRKDVNYKWTEESAVGEHAEQKDHFNKVKILNKEQNYGQRVVKEAIEIESVQLTSAETTVGKLVIPGSQ